MTETVPNYRIKKNPTTGKWWICNTGDPEITRYGPYDTAKEADEDRKGLLRFWDWHNETVEMEEAIWEDDYAAAELWYESGDSGPAPERGTAEWDRMFKEWKFFND